MSQSMLSSSNFHGPIPINLSYGFDKTGRKGQKNKLRHQLFVNVLCIKNHYSINYATNIGMLG